MNAAVQARHPAVAKSPARQQGFRGVELLDIASLDSDRYSGIPIMLFVREEARATRREVTVKAVGS